MCYAQYVSPTHSSIRRLAIFKNEVRCGCVCLSVDDGYVSDEKENWEKVHVYSK